jgi:ankyrin repeat protein
MEILDRPSKSFDNSEHEEQLSKFVHADPLEWACEQGNLDFLEYLLHNGYEYQDGADAACEFGHLNIIEFLYEKGVESDNIVLDTACVLDRACFSGHIDIVKYLCSKGIKHDCGSIAYAKHYGYHDIVEYLCSINQ